MGQMNANASVGDGGQQNVQGDQTQEQGSTTQQGVTLPDQRAREIARLTGALSDRQKEIATLKDQVAQLSGGHGQNQNGGNTPPTIEGDQDGMYELLGTRVPVEFAKNYTAMASKLDTLEKAINNSRSQGEFDRHQQDLLKVQQDFAGEVQGAIGEIREKMFPGVPKDVTGDIDQYIFDTTDAMMSEALRGGGQLTSEVVNKAMADAFAKAEKVFSVFGSKQVADNLQYTQRYGALSSGQPAVSAQKLSQMTATEREAWARGNAAAANANMDGST